MFVSRSPVVSIVLPTYNRAYCIDRAIQSILNQTFENWELVIVDNHSSDDTAQIVANFGDDRIRFFKFHNQGIIAASRNHGIQKAQAPIIAFLDSDDWWTPDKLQKCLSAFDAGADVVYHTLTIVNSMNDKSKQCIDVRRLESPVFQDLLTRGNTLPTSGTMVRKLLLEQVGGFSEAPDMVAWEDYDCWLRIARLTEKYSLIPDALGYYWVGGDNISSAPRILDNLAAMKKHYFNDQSDVLPFWYYDRMALAYHHLKQHLPAYQNKFRAFWLAPDLKFKWNITKVFIKWLLRLS